MLKSHIKIAFRNLWKNKVFSIINIIGLSIGFSAAFVIGLIINYDYSFDKFHTDHENIYRITTTFNSSEGEFLNRGVPVPIRDAVNNISGIELVAPFFTTYIDKIENKASNKKFKNIEDAIYADENYFKLFNYNWLAGSSEQILLNPNELVLTYERASKYFPNLKPQEIIGKTLVYDDTSILTITGIVAKQTKNTDLNFQEFLSMQTAKTNFMKKQIYTDNWGNTNSATQVFVKLQNINQFENVQNSLAKLSEEQTSQKMVERGYTRNFILQPLKELHFSKSGIFNNSGDSASKNILYSLGVIAVFLLILGCINFINLNTAQATNRSLEIGIRKTLGSSKKQLVFQFLGETFILTLGALLISLVLSKWLLNMFSDFIPKGIIFNTITNPLMLIAIVLLLLLVTFLSGFYPALYLSKFKPISVLKKQVHFNDNNVSLRKYLTVFQFIIAQVFIIFTLLVSKQMYFLMHKDIGVKTEAIAFMRLWNDKDYTKRLTLLNEIKAIPNIAIASLGGDPPVSSNYQGSFATFSTNGKEINTGIQKLSGDLDYSNLYNIEIIAGRKRLNDTIKEFIINKTYLNLLGFQNPEDAIGQIINMGNEAIPIVGVMNDFNQSSLKEKINPIVLLGDLDRNKFSKFNTLHFLINGSSENWPETIKKIKNKWNAIYPDSDFEVNFVDETIKQFYEQERKTSILLKWATGLAILISCLGLLGLVIYTTQKRTKEIGIRKVLGASLTELNILLCKDFIILVAIGFFIATPIAWYGLNKWLENFAFKTTISWWVFLFSGLTMLIITLVVVSFKTIATAKSNPVDSLQTE